MALIPMKGDLVFLVDDQDDERFMQYTWYRGRHGYPITVIEGAWLSAHHFLFGRPPKGLVWDHIDRNKLNNQRSNLHQITQAANTHNSDRSLPASGYRGVYKAGNRWRARICINYKPRNLGVFATPEEAAIVVDRAMLAHYGPNTFTNMPKENSNG